MSEAIPGERYLFNSRLDRVYFSLHAVFLFLLPLMSLGLIPAAKWSNLGVRLVVAIVFFNALHTGLTWAGLMLLPEMRQWVRAQWNLEGRFGKMRRWLILSFLAIIGYAILEIFYIRSVSVELLRTLSLILLIFSAFHNVGQTKGLALMLTSKQVRDSKSLKWERWILNSFVIVIALGAVRLVTKSEFWKSLLPMRWELYCFSVGALLFLALMIIVYRQEGTCRTKKFWFTSTAVYHPLLLVSPAAFVFQRALHGVEYLFLAIRMANRSKVKFVAISWVVIAAPLILIGVGQFGKLKGFNAFIDSINSSSWFPVLIFVALWIEFTHYYLDSIMFRYQDPLVRETIGPLIAERV